MENNNNYPFHSDEMPPQPYKKPRYSSNERNMALPPPPNQLFYKTRLCVKYEHGCCPYGDKCTFAHGADDLRRAPPNWQEILQNQQPMQGGGNKNYSSAVVNPKPYGICWKFNMGEECIYGDKCIYKHVRPDQTATVNYIPFEEPRQLPAVATTQLRHGRHGGLMNKVGCRTEPVGVSSIDLPLLRDDDGDDEYPYEGNLTGYFKMTDPVKISRVYGDWI